MAPLGALLQHLAPLLGPLRPRWNTYKASRAVLKVSRTHLLLSRRPFGAFLGRLRRARGALGEPSEAPKTFWGCFFLPLRIPLRFDPPFSTPSGALLGRLPSLFEPLNWPSWTHLRVFSTLWTLRGRHDPPPQRNSGFQKKWGGGVCPLRGVQLNESSSKPLRQPRRTLEQY